MCILLNDSISSLFYPFITDPYCSPSSFFLISFSHTFYLSIFFLSILLCSSPSLHLFYFMSVISSSIFLSLRLYLSFLWPSISVSFFQVGDREKILSRLLIIISFRPIRNLHLNSKPLFEPEMPQSKETVLLRGLLNLMIQLGGSVAESS